MKVLTLGGQAGAGAPEIGSRVARVLGYKYVEHLALRRLARRLDATAEAVTKKELAFGSRKDRFLQQLELVFSHYGWYGADMSMGGAPPPEYVAEMLEGKKHLPAEISTGEYIDAINKNADQFANEGSLLLVKRAGVVTLKDRPGITHIGLFAPRDTRVSRVSHRLKIGFGEAEQIVTGLERAREAWFRAIGEVDPADPALYDLSLGFDTEMDDDKMVQQIVDEVNDSHPDLLDDRYVESEDASIRP